MLREIFESMFTGIVETVGSKPLVFLGCGKLKLS